MDDVKFSAEGDADTLRRMAGLGADEVASPLWIARKLLGADAVRDVPMVGRYATLARVGDRRVIAVNPRLADATYQWAIGHELGHWIRGTGHGERDCEEAACHYVAAALLMPRAAFLGAYRRRGHDASSVHQLALAFGVTDTSAALRIGETDGRPVAVVAPHRIFARGDAEWPEEAAIRTWAKRGNPSLSRVRLVDDCARVALVQEIAA
jgi:hypothetical protein